MIDETSPVLQPDLFDPAFDAEQSKMCAIALLYRYNGLPHRCVTPAFLRMDNGNSVTLWADNPGGDPSLGRLPVATLNR